MNAQGPPSSGWTESAVRPGALPPDGRSRQAPRRSDSARHRNRTDAAPGGKECWTPDAGKAARFGCWATVRRAEPGRGGTTVLGERSVGLGTRRERPGAAAGSHSPDACSWGNWNPGPSLAQRAQ